MTIKYINLQSYYLMKNEIEEIFGGSSPNRKSSNQHAQLIYDKIVGGHTHDNYSQVSYTQTLSSGVTGNYKIGELTIDGNKVDILGKDTDTNTTYSNATANTAGLMSGADKDKLDKLNASTIDFTADTAAWGTGTASTSVNKISIALNSLKNTCNTNTQSINNIPVYQADNQTLLKNNNTFSIKSGGITNTHIASNAIKTGNIENGTILNEDISTNANISMNKISGLNDALSGKSPTGHNHDGTYVPNSWTVLYDGTFGKIATDGHLVSCYIKSPTRRIFSDWTEMASMGENISFTVGQSGEYYPPHPIYQQYLDGIALRLYTDGTLYAARPSGTKDAAVSIYTVYAKF